MNIDSFTGRVELEGINLIGPQLKQEVFVASPFWQRSRRGLVNKQWVSYSVSAKDGSNEFAVTLVFFGDEIVEIRMAKNEPSATWTNWSEERELQRKADHDCLLKALLGRAPYRFAWGEVTSIFDAKSGSSEIIVRYKLP